MPTPALPTAIDAVVQALDDTEREYARMPFFVRPLVRRGFVRRTGRDFDAWRAVLSAAARGTIAPDLARSVAALAEHYRGAPARARRGMGATESQLAIVEERSRARADAADALATALRG